MCRCPVGQIGNAPAKPGAILLQLFSQGVIDCSFDYASLREGICEGVGIALDDSHILLCMNALDTGLVGLWPSLIATRGVNWRLYPAQMYCWASATLEYFPWWVLEKYKSEGRPGVILGSPCSFISESTGVEFHTCALFRQKFVTLVLMQHVTAWGSRVYIVLELMLWIMLLVGWVFLLPCLRAPGRGVPGFLAGLALVFRCCCSFMIQG